MIPFVENIRKKLYEHAPSGVLANLHDELKRLSEMPHESPDYHSLKIYLKWVSELPWKDEKPIAFNSISFHHKMDAYHVGRKKLKDRLAEYFAVAGHQNSLQGMVFCFVGPPGVGKTNLARAVAKAAGKNIIEFRVSELETEESLRGRKREGQFPTPGKILESLRKVKSKGPVILLKGLDRPGSRWAVDPINALMQLFDPAQNSAFVDHYLSFPFNLSDVLFITTALTLDDVPSTLEDRMEIFQLNAYTPEEKLHIVKKHLLPQKIKSMGLNKEQIKMPGESLTILINQYTREAGVHYLEFLLTRICRNAAYQLLDRKLKNIFVDKNLIFSVLGPRRYYAQARERRARPGLVTGLCWTPYGGDIMFIEVSVMPGKGNLLITGQLGDVMRESVEIAVSFLRSEAKRFGLAIHLNHSDLHIHVPAGAIQKDGPSAGIAVMTALFSWFHKVTVDPSTALTGEITLRGAVMRVGAVKEKVIAAHRAGIKTIILPQLNEQDLIEVSDEIRSQMKFIFVDSADKVLEATLGIKYSLEKIA
ncbi:MAG: AAA family ATPase [Deltaproteobacteria bacterium]|nr:AAA family ATPase [Deltaproteobacteria bacterium]